MTSDYNRIHSLAGARLAVLNQFGSNLLNYWALSDDTQFIRDLLRKKPIFGSGVSMQVPGVLDFGVDLETGYISDLVNDQGDHSYVLTQPSWEVDDYELAVPVPLGRWKSMLFRNSSESVLSPGVIIAPADTAPSSVVANKVVQVDSVIEPDSKARYLNIQKTTGANGQFDLQAQASGNSRVGQEMTLDGAIYQASFRLKKTGTPTGTLFVHVSDSAGTWLYTANTTLDISTIGTSFAWYDFYFDELVDIPNSEVRVMVACAYGDASNYISVERGDATLSGNLERYNASSGWADETSYDCMIKLISPQSVHQVTFPFELDADLNQYWAYLKGNSVYLTSGGGMAGKKWNPATSVWDAQSNVLAEFRGADAEHWYSRDKFTVGVIVNLDESSGDGTLVAISDGAEAKVSIRVTSLKKIDVVVKNVNGDSKTVSLSTTVHSGFNLITLSYEKNVAVKLGINGTIVDTQVPTNFPILDGVMALSVGALVKTDKAMQDQLPNAIVDDVFIAQDVMTDAQLWDIYESFVSSTPMMLEVPV